MRKSRNGLNSKKIVLQLHISEKSGRGVPKITAEELRKILGISKTAVDNNISFLRENGYIERVGSKKQGIGMYYNAQSVLIL